MAIVTDLHQLSKGKLIQIVLDQQHKIQSLEQEIQRLNDRLYPPKKSRFHFPVFHRRSKSPGAKPGHRGWFRAKPKRVDRVVEQTLERCPDCHTRLGPSVEVTEHIQEDVIPAQVEATCFKRHRYYCSGCQKMVTAPYASEEIPHSDWGPHILTHAVLFKYVHGLPFNKIRTAFAQLANLTVSEGGLAEALQRLARWLNVETHELLKAIQTSRSVHVDETGWKLTGVNHWLWAFVTEKLAYYRIDPSR